MWILMLGGSMSSEGLSWEEGCLFEAWGLVESEVLI